MSQAGGEPRDWGAVFWDLSDQDSGSLAVADVERLATAAYLIGEVDAAVDALAHVHHRYVDRDDSVGAVRSAFWAVFILMGRGSVAQAGGWMARCERIAHRSANGSLERAYVDLMAANRLALQEGEWEAAAELADQVVDVAHQAGEDDLAAMALMVAGRSALRRGNVEVGLSRLDEAMVGVIASRTSPIVAGTVYCSLLEGCEEIGERARTVEWTEALYRWCNQQGGMITFTGRCLTHRASLLQRRGDLVGATEEAQRACAAFGGASDEYAAGMAWYQLGEVHRVSGNLDAAETAYRQASTWGHSAQPGLMLLTLARGDHAGAASAAQRLFAGTPEMVDRIRLLPAVVEVTLAGGDTALAEDAADELVELASRFGIPALLAEAETARGRVMLAGGDSSEAASVLAGAVRAWAQLGAPYEAARARLSLAEALAAADDIDGARQQAELARDGLAEIGAAEPGRPEAGHPLSRRELEVLRHVATGATNQQIAEKLFLSVKTVDRHVGNILAKLGVSSRTAAATHAYRQGLI